MNSPQQSRKATTTQHRSNDVCHAPGMAKDADCLARLENAFDRLQILLQQGDLDFASYMKWRARVNETMMGLHDGINADVLRIL